MADVWFYTIMFDYSHLAIIRFLLLVEKIKKMDNCSLQNLISNFNMTNIIY